MSINLTQFQADNLLAMEKHRANNETYRFPNLGGRISAPLVAPDGSENFYLDIHRGRVNLVKGTFQNRARSVIILARLDFGGAPHRNPDDEEIPCPHLHRYREGYGDRWAEKAPADVFRTPDDHWQTFLDFMVFCNVTRPPEFNRGLFP